MIISFLSYEQVKTPLLSLFKGLKPVATH